MADNVEKVQDYEAGFGLPGAPDPKDDQSSRAGTTTSPSKPLPPPPADVPDLPDTVVGLKATSVYEVEDPDPRLSTFIDEVTARIGDDGRLMAVQDEDATDEPMIPVDVPAGADAPGRPRKIRVLF